MTASHSRGIADGEFIYLYKYIYTHIHMCEGHLKSKLNNFLIKKIIKGYILKTAFGSFFSTQSP